MNKYKYLLFGQKFDLYTDYQALRGILNNKSDDVSSRIVKLLSKTTDYFPNEIYKKREDNAVADTLSRAYYTFNLDSEDLDISKDFLKVLSNEELNLVNEVADTAETPLVSNPDTQRNHLNFNRSTYIWINEQKSQRLIKDYLKK